MKEGILIHPLMRGMNIFNMCHSIEPFLFCLLFTVTGVAVGSGWQAWVAYINLGCYYVVGLPLGILLGMVFDLGVKVCATETYLYLNI
jgi:Na+-driven multidrug efflux pump